MEGEVQSKLVDTVHSKGLDILRQQWEDWGETYSVLYHHLPCLFVVFFKRMRERECMQE